jgi:hypothetical protein
MVFSLNRSVKKKKILLFLLFHGLLRIKFYLFLLELEIKMTFKYTGCAIFLIDNTKDRFVITDQDDSC